MRRYWSDFSPEIPREALTSRRSSCRLYQPRRLERKRAHCKGMRSKSWYDITVSRPLTHSLIPVIPLTHSQVAKLRPFSVKSPARNKLLFGEFEVTDGASSDRMTVGSLTAVCQYRMAYACTLTYQHKLPVHIYTRYIYTYHINGTVPVPVC